jgi:hypothetical protein
MFSKAGPFLNLSNLEGLRTDSLVMKVESTNQAGFTISQSKGSTSSSLYLPTHSKSLSAAVWTNGRGIIGDEVNLTGVNIPLHFTGSHCEPY